MACRDCEFWDLTTLEASRGAVLASCSFDIAPLWEEIPRCVEMTFEKKALPPLAGEGCHQFKERPHA